MLYVWYTEHCDILYCDIVRKGIQEGMLCAFVCWKGVLEGIFISNIGAIDSSTSHTSEWECPGDWQVGQWSQKNIMLLKQPKVTGAAAKELMNAAAQGI